MPEILYSAAIVVAAVGIGFVTHKVRTNDLSGRAAFATAVLCFVGLLAMILTDWPSEVLNKFWADHSVLAGMLSSLLLVGLVFLAYERSAQRRQLELADGLSGAGLGGIVDHVIDIEAALAITSQPLPPDQIAPQDWGRWDMQGKPLRWLRNGREILIGECDPRKLPVRCVAPSGTWERELIDQSIRRLLAAMRDWTPLIGASEDGITVLLLLSKVRADLMALQDLYPPQGQQSESSGSSTSAAMIEDLRIRLRVFAICFENWSGARKLRPEILDNFEPLPNRRPNFDHVNKSLATRLDKACDELGFKSVELRRFELLTSSMRTKRSTN